MTSALRVVRCAGCAALEEEAAQLRGELLALQEALLIMAESQNFVDSAEPVLHTVTTETGEITMPEAMADAPIRDRFVVTIPPAIRERLNAAIGDSLRFKVDEEGVVTIRLMRLEQA